VLKSIGCILIVGLAIALEALAGQAPVVEQPFKFTATAKLVLLDVSVKDPHGGNISGLAMNNFRVYENGKLQSITHFAHDDVPVTAGLVIDTSGSMRMKYQEVATAALVFIRASNRDDEVFVVNFSDSVRFGLPKNIPFTDDIGILHAALSRGIPEGRTAFNDAVVFSLNHLDKGKRDKKALVLVSDGGDNNSANRSADVMKIVRESRATIYAIGIYDADDPERNPRVLQRLAQISGGEAFLGVQLSEVAGICRQIASDIRSRYTIGYVPIQAGEWDSLRKIKVVASQPGGQKLLVHTRTSYLLPANPVASGPAASGLGQVR
jgi:Ca-activated chloride channel family protein